MNKTLLLLCLSFTYACGASPEASSAPQLSPERLEGFEQAFTLTGPKGATLKLLIFKGDRRVLLPSKISTHLEGW